MLHSKIMGILLSLHEKATGPLQRVFELCMEAMENVEGEIKSVAELPQIPFTDPIKRKNRVVATFYAKLRPFGDHFWTFIPNLHQNEEHPRHLLARSFPIPGQQ